MKLQKKTEAKSYIFSEYWIFLELNVGLHCFFFMISKCQYIYYLDSTP